MIFNIAFCNNIDKWKQVNRNQRGYKHDWNNTSKNRSESLALLSGFGTSYQSGYDCPSASEATLKDRGKCITLVHKNWYQNQAQHKAVPISWAILCVNGLVQRNTWL